MKLTDVMSPSCRFIATCWYRVKTSKRPEDWIVNSHFFDKTAQNAAQLAQKQAEAGNKLNNGYDYGVTVAQYTIAIEPPEPTPLKLIDII